MAIKNIIARGIGFSPGSVKFIVTHGFIAGVAIFVPSVLTTGSKALVSASGGVGTLKASGGTRGVSGSGGGKSLRGTSGC